MNTFMKLTLVAALLVGGGVVGCDSDTPSATPGTGTGGAGGSIAVGGTGGAGGSGAGGHGGGVPIVDWVTDLVENHSDDTSKEDTVEDKVIIDTDDPQAFDPLLAR